MISTAHPFLVDINHLLPTFCLFILLQPRLRLRGRGKRSFFRVGFFLIPLPGTTAMGFAPENIGKGPKKERLHQPQPSIFRGKIAVSFKVQLCLGTVHSNILMV